MLRLKLLVVLILLLSLTIQAKTIDKILVIVGDKIITQYEVESFNPKKVKEIYSVEDEQKRNDLLKKYYQSVLEFLVNQYTIEIAAEREGIKIGEDEVDMAINQILEKNNITKEQLEQLLEKEDLTFQKYKWQIKMDIINARLNSRVILPRLVVAEEDIKKYIDENNSILDLDDSFELRMIVIEKDKEDDLKKELGKTSFADLAIKYSTDKSAKSGGYIGNIKLGFLPDNLKEKFKDVKKGDIVRIEDGDVVKYFFVENFKSKYDIDEKLKSEIVDKLKKAQYQKVYDNWLEEHKKTIFVKYMN
ncbi:SurA N-terminal domain-containing protein [Deferribacterales bacterium Es71-Z0220]|uniref:SurA N-terminal domain-containing protein n=1 Tax=Deferrivibrio essentukiensis TaxID=2880922 RepID=UPI001F60829E|nr:SurA N-terminal domain-containing protein [Deferrivibrio essentukiensis]MCB4204040.1 SurA N-terminal domain-containing protein [Deferrivibrio essentukiensis]